MFNRVKTIALLAITFSFLFLVGGCKKEEAPPAASDNNESSNPAPAAAFSFKEASNLIVVDSAKAILYTSGMVGAQGTRKLDVYAFKNGQQILEFHFSPKTGTQTVSQNGNSAWLTYITNNGNTYPDDFYHCTSGNFNLLVCDTINNSISGTFDFTGSNGTLNKTITEGKIVVSVIKKQN